MCRKVYQVFSKSPAAIFVSEKQQEMQNEMVQQMQPGQR